MNSLVMSLTSRIATRWLNASQVFTITLDGDYSSIKPDYKLTGPGFARVQMTVITKQGNSEFDKLTSGSPGGFEYEVFFDADLDEQHFQLEKGPGLHAYTYEGGIDASQIKIISVEGISIQPVDQEKIANAILEADKSDSTIISDLIEAKEVERLEASYD